MARHEPRPTDAELEILRVMWEEGPGTVRRIHQALVARRAGRCTSYNTTLKLLQIMHTKGMVDRDTSQRPQVYRPATTEGRMQQRLVDDLLQRAFGGSARKLAVALTAADISDEDLAEIRRLLAKSREEKP